MDVKSIDPGMAKIFLKLIDDIPTATKVIGTIQDINKLLEPSGMKLYVRKVTNEKIAAEEV